MKTYEKMLHLLNISGDDLCHTSANGVHLSGHLVDMVRRIPKADPDSPPLVSPDDLLRSIILSKRSEPVFVVLIKAKDLLDIDPRKEAILSGSILFGFMDCDDVTTLKKFSGQLFLPRNLLSEISSINDNARKYRGNPRFSKELVVADLRSVPDPLIMTAPDDERTPSGRPMVSDH